MNIPGLKSASFMSLLLQSHRDQHSRHTHATTIYVDGGRLRVMSQGDTVLAHKLAVCGAVAKTKAGLNESGREGEGGGRERVRGSRWALALPSPQMSWQGGEKCHKERGDSGWTASQKEGGGGGWEGVGYRNSISPPSRR